MYTIVRKDCLCLAAGFLQMYVDVYVRSLLYLTGPYVSKVCIHTLCIHISNELEIHIIMSIVHCPAHTPRFARTQCFGVGFFINCLFFNSYYGFMSEPKILFDDKAVYIHMFICGCTYMYSLRKCTVVSCNAACLSWFP